MKKNLIIAAMALMFSVPSLMAQDFKMQEKSIAKSNLDVENPKKSGKFYTWLDRGTLMFDAVVAPIKGLYDKMPETEVVEKFGKGQDLGEAEVGGVKGLKAVEYPNFTVYYQKVGLVYKILCWDQKVSVAGASLDKAAEAFVKAYGLTDNEDDKKLISESLAKVSNQYKVNANNFQDKDELEKAADDCLAAYEVSILPALNKPDTVSVYYAGNLYARAEKFEKGAKYLEIAADHGMAAEGDTYYYIAYCYTSLQDQDAAKAALEKGVARFPANPRLTEMLATMYANSDDAENHLEFVEKAAQTMGKADMWNAVGRVYDKKGEKDKAMESFQKAYALNSDDYSSNFNVGLMLVKKGQAEIEAVNTRDYSNQNEYDAALKKATDILETAMPYLEKAYSLNTQELSLVKLLKDVTFVQRDRDAAHKAAYETYLKAYKELGGTE